MIPQHPKKTKFLSCHCKNKVIMVWETKFPLFAEETLLLLSPFPVSFPGTDGCNGILLLETAVGVVGIIA